MVWGVKGGGAGRASWIVRRVACGVNPYRESDPSATPNPSDARAAAGGADNGWPPLLSVAGWRSVDLRQRIIFTFRN